MANIDLMKKDNPFDLRRWVSEPVKKLSASLADKALGSASNSLSNSVKDNIVGNVINSVNKASTDPEAFKNEFESNARNTFAKKQQSDLNSMRNLSGFDALSAFKGAEYVNPETIKSVYDAASSMDKPRSFIRDLYNRSQTGLELPDIINFTSQHKTPAEYRPLWDAYHAANSSNAGIKPAQASPDDIALADDIENNYLPKFDTLADSNDPNIVRARSLVAGSPINEGFADWLRTPVVDPSRGDFDDGSVGSWESDMVRGDEYIRQREYGLPGRPVKDINPDWYYNKYDEMRDHGYVPYIVTDEGLERFHNGASWNEISNIFTNVRDARKMLTDSTATMDGREYSMKDVLKNLQIQGDNIERQINTAGGESITKEPIDDMSIPMTALRQDEDGNVHYVRAVVMNDDDSISVLYDDGLKDYDNFDSFSADVSMGMQQLYPGSAALQYTNGISPIELDDGTYLRYDKACAIVSDKVPVDRGFLNLGDQLSREVLDDFPNNLEFIAPWALDMIGSSAPLFKTQTAWTQAIADAAGAWRGFQPGRYDYLDNSYRTLSENPSHIQQLSSVMGSLLLPWTERVYGTIREGGITKPIMKLLGATGKKLGRNWPSNIEMVQPKKRIIANGLGEMSEEVPGNIIEEFKAGNGPGAWYADDLTDSNGNVIYDNQGMPVKDKNTPWEKVHQNFWGDAPNSAFGGLLMGLGTGPLQYNKYKWDYVKSHLDNSLGKPSNFYSDNVVNDVDNRTQEEAYIDNLSVPLPSYLTDRRR